jgi:ParB family chromosome partitioning protein
VRDVEELVRNVKEENTPATKVNSSKKQDDTYHQLKKHLTHFFQTPVQLTCSEKGSGKISIKFKNEQELERIIAIFDKLNQ